MFTLFTLLVLAVAAQKWEYIPPIDSSLVPPPRSFPSYAYDAAQRRVLMFGGRTFDGAVLGDFWVYSLASNTWSRPDTANDQNPHPGPRYSTISGIYSYQGKSYFIVGFGKGNGLVYSDVWRLDLGILSWSQVLTVNVGPTPRYAAVGGISDSPFTYLVVGYGTDDSINFADTWSLVFVDSRAAWFPVTVNSTSVPGPKTYAASEITAPQTLMVHGGCDAAKIGPCLSNDAWQLQMYIQNLSATPTVTKAAQPTTLALPLTEQLQVFGTWSKLVPSSSICPGRRSKSSMGKLTGTAILYGGNYGDFAGPKGQIAVQNVNGDWIILLPSIDQQIWNFPEPRQAPLFVNINYPTEQTFLLFGGTLTPSVTNGAQGYRDANDLWILRLGDQNNPFKSPFLPLNYPTIATNFSFPEISKVAQDQDYQSFYSKSYIVPCPNVDLVDPQGDGIPKVDSAGNSLPRDILPNLNGPSKSVFLLIHSVLMFIAFGVLGPFAIWLSRYTKISRRFFMHGVLYSVSALLAIVSLIFAVLMNQIYANGKHFSDFHSLFGLIVIAAVVFIVANALLTDTSDSSTRQVTFAHELKEIDNRQADSFMMPGSSSQVLPSTSHVMMPGTSPVTSGQVDSTLGNIIDGSVFEVGPTFSLGRSQMNTVGTRQTAASGYYSGASEASDIEETVEFGDSTSALFPESAMNTTNRIVCDTAVIPTNHSRSNSTLSRIYNVVVTRLRWKIIHLTVGYLSMLFGLINVAVGASLGTQLQWTNLSIGWIFFVLTLFLIGELFLLYIKDPKCIFKKKQKQVEKSKSFVNLFSQMYRESKALKADVLPVSRVLTSELPRQDDRELVFYVKGPDGFVPIVSSNYSEVSKLVSKK